MSQPQHQPAPPKPPTLSNEFSNNPFLLSLLTDLVPPPILSQLLPDLLRFGARTVSPQLLEQARLADTLLPFLHQYDGWGNKLDQLHTSEAWKAMHRLAAEEGIVSLAYSSTQELQQYARVYQTVKLYLFHASSGMYTCPLAMTDGAAQFLKGLQDTRFFTSLSEAAREQIRETFQHLTSRDPAEFWTSGQWMTEINGGSDVSASTETWAEACQEKDYYRLTGLKWFTSATDAQVSLALAKVKGGSGKVSLFLVSLRDEEGVLRPGISIRRLKDKLGTRQVPTAELELDGCIGLQVSPEGRGIPFISTLLNITRLYNSVCAVSNMRRITVLAEKYACSRVVFGQPLISHGLHANTLFEMQTIEQACSLWVFQVSLWQGEAEQGDTCHQLLLRLCTPLLKLYTAKQAVKVVSEGVECFGGQGYMEDTGMPQILRDNQVLPIWEGTTNVLAMDMLRCVRKHPQLPQHVQTYLNQLVATVSHRDLLKKAINSLTTDLSSSPLPIHARALSYKASAVFTSCLLARHAAAHPEYNRSLDFWVTYTNLTLLSSSSVRDGIPCNL